MERVMVKADLGEPLIRLVCDADRKAIYVAHPDAIDAVRAGESHAVGFPTEDVFEFDAGLFATLKSEWDAGAGPNAPVWERARLYRSPASGHTRI